MPLGVPDEDFGDGENRNDKSIFFFLIKAYPEKHNPLVEPNTYTHTSNEFGIS